MKKRFITFLASLFVVAFAAAQDSTLLSMLNDSLSKNAKPEVITGTFKATQIINTPTVESPGKKGLQFLIMHRFGKLNQGGYELFGLDNATIRFGLDYGITDRLSVGIGRSSLEKTYDASFKWKVLQQTKNSVPVTVSLYELLTYTTLHYTDKPFMNARYRTAYTSQLLIARKFSSNLSLQLTPSLIHFNLVKTPLDKNTLIAIGIGGRMKITKRMSINAEYNYLPSDQILSEKVYNSFSMGLDIETGGHIFQLVFSNSQGMIGPYYLGKTEGTWGKGDIYFGFNISRFFNLKGK